MTTYTVAGRRIVIHDREEWQKPSRPVRGPAQQQSLVHHAVVHWPGASPDWRPWLDTAAYLRWAQDMYLNDPNRGYSYGYGFQLGYNPVNWNADPVVFDTWEVRGFDLMMASNDGDNGIYGSYRNPNFNGRSVSMQLAASTKFPATADQILQARYLVTLADQVYGEKLHVIPHLISDSTSCPGPVITSQIGQIATRVPASGPTPSPSPRGDHDMRFISRESGSETIWCSPDGDGRYGIRSLDHLAILLIAGAIDATGKQLATYPASDPRIWQQIAALPTAELNKRLGPPS